VALTRCGHCRGSWPHRGTKLQVLVAAEVAAMDPLDVSAFLRAAPPRPPGPAIKGVTSFSRRLQPQTSPFWRIHRAVDNSRQIPHLAQRFFDSPLPGSARVPWPRPCVAMRTDEHLINHVHAEPWKWHGAASGKDDIVNTPLPSASNLPVDGMDLLGLDVLDIDGESRLSFSSALCLQRYQGIPDRCLTY
jgi:hypothetical protein